MYVCFEVFQRSPNGSVLWMGSASSREGAEQVVADAMRSVAGDYLIFRSDTLETEIISPQGVRLDSLMAGKTTI